jgi:hypothetical protein
MTRFEQFCRFDRWLTEFYEDEPLTFNVAFVALGGAMGFFGFWIADLLRGK